MQQSRSLSDKCFPGYSFPTSPHYTPTHPLINSNQTRYKMSQDQSSSSHSLRPSFTVHNSRADRMKDSDCLQICLKFSATAKATARSESLIKRASDPLISSTVSSYPFLGTSLLSFLSFLYHSCPCPYIALISFLFSSFAFLTTPSFAFLSSPFSSFPYHSIPFFPFLSFPFLCFPFLYPLPCLEQNQ